MALALNNLKRVDMPLNKETKPNQTIHYNNFKFTDSLKSAVQDKWNIRLNLISEDIK